jgi:RHS repeat-associated protein
MVSATAGINGTDTYGYGPDSKRVYKMHPNGNEEYYFWLGSKKLGAYTLGTNGSGSLAVASGVGTLWFGNRKVLTQDRIGSTTNNYYPYGEDGPTAPPSDADKFATYYRDQTTGLDYADHRYYSSSLGRFLTSDPYVGSGGVTSPASWNRYSYVQNDPVNAKDSFGLWGHDPDMATPDEPPDLGLGGGSGCDPFSSPFGPGSNCGDGPEPVPTPLPPPNDPPPPSCDINFQYREFGGFPGSLLVNAGHAYLHVHTDTADYVVEGYRDSGKMLRGEETDHGLARDNKATDSSAGQISGSFVCNWLSTIDTAVARINQDNVKYNLTGPNSSTALAYVLSQLPATMTSWWTSPGLVGFYQYPF